MKQLSSATAEHAAAIAAFNAALGRMVGAPNNAAAAALIVARDQVLLAHAKLQNAMIEATDAALTGDLFEQRGAA